MPKPKRSLNRRFFQKCGSIGGKTTAAKLSAEERKELGRKLVQARLAAREKRSAPSIPPAST